MNVCPISHTNSLMPARKKTDLLSLGYCGNSLGAGSVLTADSGCLDTCKANAFEYVSFNQILRTRSSADFGLVWRCKQTLYVSSEGSWLEL